MPCIELLASLSRLKWGIPAARPLPFKLWWKRVEQYVLESVHDIWSLEYIIIAIENKAKHTHDYVFVFPSPVSHPTSLLIYLYYFQCMLYFRRNPAQVGMVRVKLQKTIHFQYLMDWIEHVALLFANVSSQCTYMYICCILFIRQRRRWKIWIHSCTQAHIRSAKERYKKRMIWYDVLTHWVITASAISISMVRG